MACQIFVIGVDGEEAEKRGTAGALVIHTHTAKIRAAGSDIDGLVGQTFGGEGGLVVTHRPATKEVGGFSLRHSGATKGG